MESWHMHRTQKRGGKPQCMQANYRLRSQILVPCAEASAQFQLVPSQLQDGVYQVQLLNGVTADIKIPDEWPNTDADVALLGVQGAAGPLTVDEITEQVAHSNQSSTNSLLAVLNAIVTRVQ